MRTSRKRLRTYVLYITSVGSTFAKKTMRSNLPQERIDFYNRVLETYKEIIKVDPNYPFNKHCEEWSVRSDRISRWLVNHNIFVSRLKEEAIERLSREASERARSAQRVGAFVSVRPENDAMSGWRNTEIARVDVYLPGKVRLSLRKATAAEIISVVSTYAEKSSRYPHVRA